MCMNLTNQVRSIAAVTTAVANGNLTQKVDIVAEGEIAELKGTINSMVDQLSVFASEVTRVTLEVGSQGKLGGQVQVEGVSGEWKHLTDNVRDSLLRSFDDGLRRTLGQSYVRQPDESSAVDCARDNRCSAGQPDAESRHCRGGRDCAAQGHDQLDGGPAQRVRVRGHTCNSRGWLRRKAWWSGSSRRCQWRVEASDRQCMS